MGEKFPIVPEIIGLQPEFQDELFHALLRNSDAMAAYRANGAKGLIKFVDQNPDFYKGLPEHAQAAINIVDRKIRKAMTNENSKAAPPLKRTHPILKILSSIRNARKRG